MSWTSHYAQLILVVFFLGILWLLRPKGPKPPFRPGW